MRIEQIKIYSFSELSEQAQNFAIETFNETNNAFWDFHWSDYKNSLDKFCKILGIDYKIVETNWNTIKVKLNAGNEFLEYSEKRGYLYIFFIKSRYFVENRKFYSIGYKKERKSQVFFTKDCTLTGFFCDNVLTAPFFDGTNLVKLYKGSINIEDIILQSFADFSDAVNRECEYTRSRECIIDNIESNHYEFYENGKQYF